MLRIVVVVAALAVIGYAFVAAFKASGEQTIGGGPINSGFETGDLTGWTKTGDAFNNQPTFGDNPAARNRENSNHQGDWWIGGYENFQNQPGQKPGDVLGDAPTGTLTSQPFVIRGDYLSFLVGGGAHSWKGPDGANAACVNLIVNGQVVRTAMGNNSETMNRYFWIVSPLKGQMATLQLVDHNSGGWGHINFDDPRQLSKWAIHKGDHLLYLWSGVLLLLGAVGAGQSRAAFLLHWLLLYVWRFLFFCSGVATLLLSAAHETPWQMKYIQSALADRTLAHAQVFSIELAFSIRALAGSMLLLFVGSMLVAPSLRQLLQSARHHPRQVSLLLPALGYLFVTLWPSPGRL
jgi:hypothetical protein